MRRFLRAVPALCTLLLLGLGAFMPRLVSLALDGQLENDVALLENQSISLALEQETDFFQTLDLLGSVTSQVELSGGYRMQFADAEAAAEEVRMRIAASDASYGRPEITPVLITSKNTGLSGIFWHCVWLKEVINASKTSMIVPVVLLLDDQSGRMVSFSGPVERATLSAPNRLFPQSAVDVAEYCRQYYPVDTVKLAPASEDDPNGQFTITLLRRQNGQEDAYSIPIRIVDGWLYFST